MGNSKNLHVFDFTILLKWRKFDTRKIFMFLTAIGGWCHLVNTYEVNTSLAEINGSLPPGDDFF